MIAPDNEEQNNSDDSTAEICSRGPGTSRSIPSCSRQQTTEFASDVITLDESDEEPEDDSENNPNIWSLLPSLCVQNIYSFLDRNDQSRMSLACKRWANQYGSPCIWKTVKFHLPEHVYESDVYPEVKFARKYGVMFRNVEIICKIVRHSLLRTIGQQLKLFLESLSIRSQLVSIKMKNIHNYLRNVQNCMREEVIASISHFFRSQNNLRTVEFYDTNFSKQESTNLLKALLERNESTVKKLILKTFVINSMAMDRGDSVTPNQPEVGDKILDLHTLETDYTQFFEDMIHWCYVEDASSGLGNLKRKRTLSNIKITCEGGKRPLFRGISTAVWKHLNSRCPDLEIDFDLVSGPQPHLDIPFFLMREMPLRHLEFRMDKRNAPARIDINYLFDHIVNSRFNATLEALNVNWGRSIPEFSQPLIALLRSCPKLKFLQITAQFPVVGIEIILKSILERRPNALISFNLEVAHVTREEEHANLLALAEEYYALLKVINIEMNLLPEQGWRTRRAQHHEVA